MKTLYIIIEQIKEEGKEEKVRLVLQRTAEKFSHLVDIMEFSFEHNNARDVKYYIEFNRWNKLEAEIGELNNLVLLDENYREVKTVKSLGVTILKEYKKRFHSTKVEKFPILPPIKQDCATEVKFDPNKTFATKENMVKAINKFEFLNSQRYLTLQNEQGRFFPVFLWNESVSNRTGVMAIHIAQAGFCVAN